MAFTSGARQPGSPDRDAERQRVVDAVAPGRRAVGVHQIHGSKLVDAPSQGWPGDAPMADGVLTRSEEIALTIVTADCLPVLLAAAESIAAVHAGWRGFAAGILHTAVARFETPSAVTAWIGPAVGACCYEVSQEVADAVARRAGIGCVRPRSPRPHLDLPGAARQVLFDAGIEDVRCSTVCTLCNREWASYRRDGRGAGRNVAAIWRKID